MMRIQTYNKMKNMIIRKKISALKLINPYQNQIIVKQKKITSLWHSLETLDAE
jgi:hypothetical protein